MQDHPVSNVRRITPQTQAACPLCGDPMPPYPAAISRQDGKTEICSACGTEEALSDYFARVVADDVADEGY